MSRERDTPDLIRATGWMELVPAIWGEGSQAPMVYPCWAQCMHGQNAWQDTRTQPLMTLDVDETTELSCAAGTQPLHCVQLLRHSCHLVGACHADRFVILHGRCIPSVYRVQQKGILDR